MLEQKQKPLRTRRYVPKNSNPKPEQRQYVHRGNVLDAKALLGTLPKETQYAVEEYRSFGRLSQSVLMGVHIAQRHGAKWYEIAAVFGVDLRTAKRWGKTIREQMAEAVTCFDGLEFVGSTLAFYDELSAQALKQYRLAALGTPITVLNENGMEAVAYVVHGPSGRYKVKMLALALEAKDKQVAFLRKLGLFAYAKEIMTANARRSTTTVTESLTEIRQAAIEGASDEDLRALILGYHQEVGETESVFS